jgi:hypothetical protein
VGRAQKFTDDFVLLEEDELPVNRQLLDASLNRLGVVAHARTSDDDGVIAPAALVPLAAVQAETADQSMSSMLNEFFLEVTPSRSTKSTGRRLYDGSARLIKPRFAMPYKQIALALAAMVFASPIYTRPAQGRISTGPLVMIDRSEFDDYRPVLDAERIASLQVR